MAQIYSKRFSSLALASSYQTVAAPTAGRVAVIRDITVGWGVTARAGGDVVVALSGTNARVWVVHITTVGTGSDHWQGNMVLPAGDTLRALTTATGTLWLTVSGYEFDVG